MLSKCLRWSSMSKQCLVSVWFTGDFRIASRHAFVSTAILCLLTGLYCRLFHGAFFNPNVFTPLSMASYQNNTGMRDSVARPKIILEQNEIKQCQKAVYIMYIGVCYFGLKNMWFYYTTKYHPPKTPFGSFGDEFFGPAPCAWGEHRWACGQKRVELKRVEWKRDWRFLSSPLCLAWPSMNLQSKTQKRVEGRLPG